MLALHYAIGVSRKERGATDSGRNRTALAVDTRGMSSDRPLVFGARVRLKQRLLSVADVDAANVVGVVTRLGARGVRVKLASGYELLVEPTMVAVID